MHDESLHDETPPLDDVSAILSQLSVCRSLVRESQECFTDVRLHTSGFDIVCRCKLGGQRLSDVLNQTLSSYVDCYDATLSRDGRLVRQLDHISLRKPEILLASIVGDRHEAAEKTIGSRRKLRRFHAVAAVDRWLVSGCLHLTSQKTVQEFLRANRDFFPISEASVVDARVQESPESMRVAIVNHARVSFMKITESSDDDEQHDGESSRMLRGDADSVTA